jgi:hypothetical protein
MRKYKQLQVTTKATQLFHHTGKRQHTHTPLPFCSVDL